MSERGFDSFYQTHRRFLLRRISVYLHRKEEAEEVLQDVFFELWRRIPQFDPDRGSLLQWAVVIARSRALDARRARGARPLEARGPEAGVEQVAGIEWRPDVKAEAARQRAALARSMIQLRSEEARLVELVYRDGMSHGDIAREQRLPLGTVKGRVRTALRKLRQSLDRSNRATRLNAAAVAVCGSRTAAVD